MPRPVTVTSSLPAGNRDPAGGGPGSAAAAISAGPRQPPPAGALAASPLRRQLSLGTGAGDVTRDLSLAATPGLGHVTSLRLKDRSDHVCQKPGADT